MSSRLNVQRERPTEYKSFSRDNRVSYSMWYSFYMSLFCYVYRANFILWKIHELSKWKNAFWIARILLFFFCWKRSFSSPLFQIYVQCAFQLFRLKWKTSFIFLENVNVHRKKVSSKDLQRITISSFY